MIVVKTSKGLFKSYKNSFYQKSLVIRTDFSNYRKHFKLWHARYFDVERRTEYQNNVRDYRKLEYNTSDPLYFDYKHTHLEGTFPQVSLFTIR